MTISKKLEENIVVIRERLGVGVTFDIGIREMKLADRDMAIIYCNGLTNNDTLVLILDELADLDRSHLGTQPYKALFQQFFIHLQVESVKTMDKVIDYVLIGQTAFFIEGYEEALIIDARSYPGRSPEEPDIERVVRGSRDGFTETLAKNTAMTRRRIRDEHLRFEMLQIGVRSKTDVSIVYLADVADLGLVKLIREKLSEIKVDGLPMAEKTIQEFFISQNFNPFPLVRFTERPDVAAVHLLEGHVLIYVDTSPSVMIMPSTFFHLVQHAEEYRQAPVTGAFIRWVRFFGIFASVFLLPLWYLYIKDPGLIPKGLDFIGLKTTGKIDVFLQIIFAEMGIDLIRMAAIHTPSPLATAMGLIAAIMIGDIAVKVGLFAPEVILYLSFAAIGLFATPSYELSLANRMVRIFLLLMVFLFKAPGFIFGTTLVLLLLISTRSLNTPYMYPFIPFKFKEMMTIVFRMSIPSMHKRPLIVHPQEETKTK